ncbi:hypothetical protein KCU88_g239, partial [Aureobasidium melanogenum]
MGIKLSNTLQRSPRTSAAFSMRNRADQRQFQLWSQTWSRAAAMTLGPAFLLDDFMLALPDSLATRELLHARDIDTINTSAIVGQQGRQRPTDHFGPINNTNRAPEQPVSVGQDRVVNVQILQNLNHRQRRAWQDGFHGLLLVQKPDVLVHVENVLVTESLDVLGHVHDLLQTYLSLAVFSVQSAYTLAAGSLLASIPSKCGLRPSVLRPACTSLRRPLAMFPAKMTLHGCASLDMWADGPVSGTAGDVHGTWQCLAGVSLAESDHYQELGRRQRVKAEAKGVYSHRVYSCHWLDNHSGFSGIQLLMYSLLVRTNDLSILHGPITLTIPLHSG